MRYLGFLIVVAVLLGTPGSAGAHGGGLDSYGGHNDRKNGGYHFHRGSLSGRSYSSKSAALRALRGASAPKPKPRPKPQPAAPRVAKPADVIRKASSTKKVSALIALLVRKKIITEAELAAEIGRR